MEEMSKWTISVPIDNDFFDGSSTGRKSNQSVELVARKLHVTLVPTWLKIIFEQLATNYVMKFQFCSTTD